MKRLFLIITMCCVVMLHAREEDEVQHVLEGNLTLPTSQQPSPLFAFGQDIVDKGNVQLFGFIDYVQGKNKKFTEAVPSMLFGVTDTLSLFLNIPVAARFTLDDQHVSGIEDMFLQTEYAYFNKDTEQYALQGTFVGTIFFPTGSLCKNPATGLGSTSFLLGTTASYMSPHWYGFVALGGLLPTNHRCGMVPNRLFYQAGLARNIAYKRETWLVTLMLEMYGTSSKKNSMVSATTTVHNSPLFGGGNGGTIVYLGPTLWFATQKLVIQAGILAPVFQSSSPNKNRYWAAFNIGWKFN